MKMMMKTNDENEDDIEYLIDRSVYFENLFRNFLTKYNIDQTPEEPIINNSTFIETPTWLALKRSVLNQQNKDNKCFQYSVILSLYRKQTGRNFCRTSCIELLSTILTGKILIFRHKNKIIKLLK